MSAAKDSKTDSKMEEKLKAAYRKFNDRIKTFGDDMNTVFAAEYPALRDFKRQLDMFLVSDPARMRLAHLAWPQFNKYRALINKRDTEVLFTHDISGLKSKAKIDVKALFSKTREQNREAIWCAIEDMLDLLDDINKLRPIPSEEDDSGADAPAQKKSRGSAPLTWHAALEEDEDDDEDEDEKEKEVKAKPEKKAGSGPSADGPAQWTKSLMSSLKDIIGGDDPAIDADFEALINKVTQESEDGKTSVKDQEMMTNILQAVITKISPVSGQEEDDSLEGMDEKEKEAEMARRKMQDIRENNELKYVVGNLIGIPSMQKTDDPVILENERKEAAAEEERMKHPEKNREYTITAHFNHKTLVFLNKLRSVRGNLTSKKDGRILFPGLSEAFFGLLAKFKENPATEEVIRPVGQWVEEHRQQLLSKDEKVWTNPDHQFLKDLNSPALWSTFKPHERANFWSLIGHPLQLATIFHNLDTPELSAIRSIVDDILGADKIAYDRDPNSLNQKQVITKAIKRGCTKSKVAKIKTLFERMSTEKDSKTLKSLAKLMQDVIPQAAGLRGRGQSHTEDDAETDGGPAVDIAAATEVKARTEKMHEAFQKILQSMPAIGPNGPETKNPAIPTVSAASVPTPVATPAPAPPAAASAPSASTPNG